MKQDHQIKSVITVLLVMLQVGALQAQKLDVEGDSKVRGRLDISNLVDATSINIGINAGLVTDAGMKYNSYVGAYAGSNNITGQNNAFFGSFSGLLNTQGRDNSFYGMFSGLSTLRGSTNSFFGAESGLSNIDGDGNCFFGFKAGHSNTQGNDNTFVGRESGKSNTSGTYNSFMGMQSGYHNTNGLYNTAGGYQALYSNTTGRNNTALGLGALFQNTSGRYNTAIGVDALSSSKTGNYNTAIGYAATFGADTLHNFTCLGFGAGSRWNLSNTVEVGNFSVQWIGGQTPWFTYSDARIKEKVRENVPGLAFISALRPVTYHLDVHKQNELGHRGFKDIGHWKGKYEIEEVQITGFIAQEVEQAALALDYDFSGVHRTGKGVDMYSLSYASFVVPLVKAVQEQQELIDAQRMEIASLNELIQRQNAQFENLKTQLTILCQTLKSSGISLRDGALAFKSSHMDDAKSAVQLAASGNKKFSSQEYQKSKVR